MFIADLPLGDLDEIRRAVNSGRSNGEGYIDWPDLIVSPARYAIAVPLFIRKVADQLGVEPPDKMTGRSALEYFQLVDDDLPEGTEDGVPTGGDDKPSTG